MSSERKEQIITILKMLLVVVCASLYAWGGMENRTLLRRILAPCLAGAGIALFSRSWWGLITAPLLGISSSLGYGADNLVYKIIKRAYCGLAFGLSGSFMSFANRKWVVVEFQTVLCVTVFTLFGVINPFGSARIEESILGLFIYAVPIISAKPKEE